MPVTRPPRSGDLLGLRLMQGQPLLLAEQLPHGLGVEPAVGLGPGPLNGGALAAIEHTELDAGSVDGPAHDAVERVQFPNQVAAAQASDGRVAGHRADGGELLGEKQGSRAQPGARGGCLGARVAGADDDHIEGPHGRENAGRGGQPSRRGRQRPAQRLGKLADPERKNAHDLGTRPLRGRVRLWHGS